jgi:hypothetical protein
MTLAKPTDTPPSAREIAPGDVPGGPSTSQTIMVASLQRLLSELPPNASADAYRIAIMNDNLLGKGTASGREWALLLVSRSDT